ncbi:UDP-N-acetylglucosamine 4,6-dehydratase (inverting) [Rhodospirillales bacterium]|nr:UDP-N-acetylglucosamine 4,6-dehydratase (inverting) [Rhodospirillales bacterium]
MTDRTLLHTFDQSIPNLNGANILVTGGTGTFGKSFAETVSRLFSPQRLIIFSRDEFKQSEMQAAYPTERFPFMRFFVGDVRDHGRLEMAMRDVDIVVHAAALKQVPTAEYNPFECINTNVLGAENVVRAAIGARVAKVIALSTDKATNPINLYGASKLASDKIFVAANNLSGDDGTIFSVVRYGNVVGSRGSVVLLYHKLVAEGAKSIPVTDLRMTRFWITVNQGVNFVLSSLETMTGGEIFVPKIPSMKIKDLAKAIAPEIPMEVIGIRPGEKIHEIMITDNDARHTWELEDRYIIAPSFQFWSNEPFTPKDGQKVGDGFTYASDTNDRWLDAASFVALLKTSADK